MEIQIYTYSSRHARDQCIRDKGTLFGTADTAVDFETKVINARGWLNYFTGDYCYKNFEEAMAALGASYDEFKDRWVYPQTTINVRQHGHGKAAGDE